MPRGRRGGRTRRLAVSFAIAVVVTAAAWAGLAAGTFQAFQLQATDTLMGGHELDDRVVVVGIDERSLAEVGEPWPWRRDLHARLLAGLFDAGAELVVVDLLFNPAREGDDALATTARGRAVVVAATAELTSRGGAGGLFLARHLVEPVPEIASAATVAHANVLRDPNDGVVRSLPLLVDTPDGRLVPSLSLAALVGFEGAPGLPIIRPQGVQVGTRLIPTAEKASLVVNFSADVLLSPADRTFVPAVDVLDGRIPEGSLQGKVVFVGAAAPGLGDQVTTPIAKARGGMPGVFVHAAAFDTMLQRGYLRDVGRNETLAWVFVMAAIVAVAVETARLLVIVPAALVTLVGYPLLAIVRFDRGEVVNLVYPMGGVVTALVAALVVWYFTEGRRRRRVSSLFSQYVPEQVADDLIAGGLLESAVSGVRVEATVLFCDLRGFTAMSAQLEPGDVRRALEVYYETLSQLILDHGGTLMQYVGDEIYAVWGAPVWHPDHTDAAVRCALAMQGARFEVNRQTAAMGLPELKWGIGVNRGPAVAAHIGSSVRRQYSLIGDTVNVGSRMCGVAKAGEIAFTSAVLDSLADPPPVTDAGPVELKGVAPGLKVWRVTAAVTAPASPA